VGFLGNLLSKIMASGAAATIESAVITGLVTTVGLLITNVTEVVNTDFANGLGIVIATALLKLLQKTLSGWQAKKKAAAG
jgi:hypothetical protein